MSIKRKGGFTALSLFQIRWPMKVWKSLHDKRFIVRYSASGGNYIQVNNFSKYNNPILLSSENSAKYYHRNSNKCLKLRKAVV